MFRVLNIRGELMEYRTKLTFALSDTEHYLIIGTWSPDTPAYGVTLLDNHCAQEMKSDPRPFQPLSVRTMKWFHIAHRLYLTSIGYRLANETEIAAAIAKYREHEHIVILDLLRSFEEYHIYQSPRNAAIFGLYPAVELTQANTAKFWGGGCEELSYRCKTIAGEIVEINSRFTFWNDNTRLMICTAEY